jgi:autotransporter-associated beta strand protein/predicted outer membrane repeat protein
VSGNSARANGGGIYTNDTLIVTNSTISGNSAGGTGGGISSNTATLTNSTVSGNSSGDFGGGIDAFTATLTNVTVSGNSAGDQGGGITVVTSATLINSIVLGNDAAANDEVFGTTSLTGGNIVGTDVLQGDTDVGDTTAAEVFAETVDIGGGVLAGVLADNGGPVETIALKDDASNLALDAGDDTLAPELDARGSSRVDVAAVANNGANISDLGAFEAAELPSLIVTTPDDLTNDFDGLTSLREAVLLANATLGDDTIAFDAALVGETITLASPLARAAGQTAILDVGANDIAIDATTVGFEGAGGFAKTGAGVLILSGTNAYTGATAVTGGLLQVDGTIVSATSVSGGGALGGNGVTGAVHVAAGGRLSPGASAGRLTTGTLAFTSALSAFAVEIGGTTAGIGGYD